MTAKEIKQTWIFVYDIKINSYISPLNHLLIRKV